MFAALFITGQPASPDAVATLVEIAHGYSPRLERHGQRLVILDAMGLQRLFGRPVELGHALRRAAVDRGLAVNVAIASTRTASLLTAIGRRGVTVVEKGTERQSLAPLPLEVLSLLEGADLLSILRRWGLRTLGEVAALPAADLFERFGAAGLELQRLARGDDERPLRPEPIDEPFEASMPLEWPIEALAPLAFVVSRLLESLCARLEAKGLAAAVLHLRLMLVTREPFVRTLELPLPLGEARVLRTLIMLDLESQTLPAAIDRVTVAIEPVRARTCQFSLLVRPHPSAEQLSTLLARLTALMGAGRCGSPVLVDSHRPDAFEMGPCPGVGCGVRGTGRDREFITERVTPGGRTRSGYEIAVGRSSLTPMLRRFRPPVPARVTLDRGRPVRVATGLRLFGGGGVATRAGPWRSSGGWWSSGAGLDPGPDQRQPMLWDRDEWDVALSDGGVYRIFCDRTTRRWFVEGMVD